MQLSRLSEDLQQFVRFHVGDLSLKVKKSLEAAKSGEASLLQTRIGKIIAAFGIGVAFLLLRKCYFVVYQRYNHYPPIISGLPYFGVVFALLSDFNHFNTKIIPQYGPLALHYMGPKQGFITINNLNLIKAIYGNPLCQTRPSFLHNILNASSSEIPDHFALVEYNDVYKARRKFAVNAVGKIANSNYLANLLRNVLFNRVFETLNDRIENSNGIWSPYPTLKHLSFNITFGALFGIENTLDINDKDYIFLCESAEVIKKLFEKAVAAEVFPVIGSVASMGVDKKILAASLAEWETFGKYIERSKERYNKNKTSKGGKLENETIFDIMYQEFEENRANSGSIVSKIDEKTFVADVTALLGAGLDTISQSLQSMILHLAKYSNVQGIIYDEIKQYCKLINNNNNNNDNDDKNDMHNFYEFDLSKIMHCSYFRAFVSEVLRLSTILARGFSRGLLSDCIVKYNIDNKGNCCDIVFDSIQNNNNNNNNSNKKYDYEYVLSKDFIVEGNFLLTNCLDGNIWSMGSKPTEFDINRWLKYENGIRKYNDAANLLSFPFSCGQRDCAGKALAKKEIYAIMANLILNYKFRSVDDNDFDIKFTNTFVRDIDPPIPVKIYRRQ